MVTIQHQSHTFTAPSSWEECTESQVSALYPCAHLQPDQITEEVRQMLAQVWLGASNKVWAGFLLSEFQWEELQKQFSFIFQKAEGRIMDTFVFKNSTYYLPEEDFGNTSSLELAMAMMYWTQFAHPTDPDTTALDKLIATLCRPKRTDFEDWQNSPDFDGDFRQKYNEVNALHTAEILDDLPMGLKMYLLDYFNQMAQSFLENYEEIFGASGHEEPLYDDGRGWLMLLKDVAKEGHFGTFDAVGRQPAHLMFASILDDTLKAKRQQQQNQSGNDDN